jgi:transposase
MAGTVRKGNRWLRTALVEAALSASRAKDSALAGPVPARHASPWAQEGVIAVAHAILTSTYYILARHVPYQELGPDYFDQHHAERARRRALQTLERQGYKVTLEPAA